MTGPHFATVAETLEWLQEDLADAYNTIQELTETNTRNAREIERLQAEINSNRAEIVRKRHEAHRLVNRIAAEKAGER